MASRYVLHGTWLSGPTYKVALMLALLGERFDYVHVDLRTGENKQQRFLDRNRFGQVPCLIDTRKELSLCQSGSILQYLADEAGNWGGATHKDQLRVREWIFWDFDRLVPGIYRPRANKLGFRKDHQSTLDTYLSDGNAALSVLDDNLRERDWIVGDHPTIADVDIYGVVSYAREAGYDLARYPHLSGWIGRIQTLPGFRPASDLLPQSSRMAD